MPSPPSPEISPPSPEISVAAPPPPHAPPSPLPLRMPSEEMPTAGGGPMPTAGGGPMPMAGAVGRSIRTPLVSGHTRSKAWSPSNGQSGAAWAAVELTLGMFDRSAKLHTCYAYMPHAMPPSYAHAHVHVHVHVRGHVHVGPRAHAHAHISMHIRMPMRISPFIHTHTYAYIRIHTHAYAYPCASPGAHLPMHMCPCTGPRAGPPGCLRLSTARSRSNPLGPSSRISALGWSLRLDDAFG